MIVSLWLLMTGNPTPASLSCMFNPRTQNSKQTYIYDWLIEKLADIWKYGN